MVLARQLRSKHCAVCSLSPRPCVVSSVLASMFHAMRRMVALSPDYGSHDRLKEVIRDTKMRIEELLRIEPDLPKALERFSDEQAVRIMTMHKSKGLEFDSVILLGVENQTFWGKADEERCAFFVGVSRAKR